MTHRISQLTPIAFAILTWYSLVVSSDNSAGRDGERERLANLLVAPTCLSTYDDSEPSYTTEAVTIPSGDIELAGQLYLPAGEGPHPGMVIMHGGGNDYDLLMSAPQFYAPRFAHCGFAALIYDKRGTGKSGGIFHESTTDDFIADAGNAAIFLASDAHIDSARIGVYGGSQGGRLAPVVAVRFPLISCVISVSGPCGSPVDQSNHNINYALRVRGYPDSVVDAVMPLWRRHHAAWGSRDPAELKAVAEEIVKLREAYDPYALPNTEQEILTDSNLFFLRPGFNSMMKDYTSELAGLRAPLLALYGELDPIINVPESVANLTEQMISGSHSDYEIFVIEKVGHSFTNPLTGAGVPTLNIYVNWLMEKLAGR